MYKFRRVIPLPSGWFHAADARVPDLITPIVIEILSDRTHTAGVLVEEENVAQELR